MKRILSLLLLALPAEVEAQFAYTTNGHGTLTITGYGGPGGAVIIPNTIISLPVTTIGVGAFYYQTSVTSVTIPDSVTNIEDSAFNGCSGLTNAPIGTSVVSVGSLVFRNCTGLRNVT